MLPDLIEILPLTKPVQAQITVPGSKSITNRALILAALAKGETTLQGALWSEDTQVMVDCLQKLGFSIKIDPDPEEYCNCILTVKGLGGEIPNAGTKEKPVELFVGNAGTAARFLTALVCLGKGVYRLHGVERMHERPQAALFKALRELGYQIDSANDKLPAVVHGTGPRAGKCTVSIEESSQFASGLLLCAKIAGWKINIVGENAEESPYVAMTSKLIEQFPKNGGSFQIEPDASSGSYFWGASWLLAKSEFFEAIKRAANDLKFSATFNSREKSQISVSNWPSSGWQADADFTIYMRGENADPPITISRAHDLADSIMTAITLSPLARTGSKSIKFTDLGRLRAQECERVEALRTELTKCGVKVIESGDTLEIFPSRLVHGAEIETYNDHRMAMCFAILGLKVPGIKIKNPACVKKTFPNFFQKLAAAPPTGLGTTILDARTGAQLTGEQLFAD